MTPLIEKLSKIAEEAHKHQQYGTESYFRGHVERVVLQCYHNGTSTEDHIILAYLHDVVEDNDFWTTARLVREGLPEHLAEPLNLLTKSKGCCELDYLLALASNHLALDVKIADAEVNAKGGRKKYQITVPLLKKLRSGELIKK